MTTPDIMPFIHVQGSWGDMGRQVGQMFAPLIDRHVEAWLGHVARRDRLLARGRALHRDDLRAGDPEPRAVPLGGDRRHRARRRAADRAGHAAPGPRRGDAPPEGRRGPRSSAPRSRSAAGGPRTAPSSTARTWTWCRSSRTSAWSSASIRRTRRPRSSTPPRGWSAKRAQRGRRRDLRQLHQRPGGLGRGAAALHALAPGAARGLRRARARGRAPAAAGGLAQPAHRRCLRRVHRRRGAAEGSRRAARDG